MGMRPRSQFVKLNNRRRCPTCGAVTPYHGTRCKRCSSLVPRAKK